MSEVNIGGERLGSGAKMNLRLKNYERSTHDLSYLWRSSMAMGTLVPFMSQVALPGDTFDIELNCDVMTLPTIGPLFGSAKIQLDIFQVPIRLYQGQLHMNALNIGMNMKNIKLPQIPLSVSTQRVYDYENPSCQINTSSILAYLGIRGVGSVSDEPHTEDIIKRNFNAVPLIAYWDIFKNYYSNKQENDAYVIHTGLVTEEGELTPIQGYYKGRKIDGSSRDTIEIFNNTETIIINDYVEQGSLEIRFPRNGPTKSKEYVKVVINGTLYNLGDIMVNDEDYYWTGYRSNDPDKSNLIVFLKGMDQSVLMAPPGSNGINFLIPNEPTLQDYDNNETIALKKFPLENIDKLRQEILENVTVGEALEVGQDIGEYAPYNLLEETLGTGENIKWSKEFSQEGLALKTYQSDLFNNWIDTEFIDGANGVNSIAVVSTQGDEFTIDALNLTMKVYKMLNRIAVSGGSYDDWLDAVYTHERARSTESPMYMGGLIKELAFQEVISNADTELNPLGTLAGRGKLTSKHKGGKVVVRVDEPSYIMGIISVTPRIDYSQGNEWSVHLNNMDDFHKPALDGIGYQDLMAEQLLWSDYHLTNNGGSIERTLGKQPAWINYMTNVNRTYGNFAEPTKEMYMTFNRQYETQNNNDSSNYRGGLNDGTTYIDPVKYNTIFAETKLDAQNLWVQISNKITARRKMSAKQIPNI